MRCNGLKKVEENKAHKPLTQTTDGKPAKPFKLRAPIKKVSDKQKKLNTQYTPLRKQFLKDHPICQANVKCQGARATEVHHRKGRGEYMLDTSTWLAVCRACHCEIELHPGEAKRLGLSDSRLSIG